MSTSKFKTILFFSFLLISCHTKKNEDEIIKKGIIKKEVKKKELTYFSFPDTVKINKLIDGELSYNLDYVDIDKKEISYRYIFLIVNVDEKDLSSYEEINNKRLLGFIDTLATGNFKFKAVFTKKGNQVLNLAIQDNMNLRDGGFKNHPDSMRVSKNEVTISKTVFVEE
jgi:Leucine-rich repeat (LRR) protein